MSLLLDEVAVKIVLKLALLTIGVELINWLIAYRTHDYKSILSNVVSTNKQLATFDAEGKGAKGATKDKEDKRRKKLEDQLTQLGVKMYWLRMRTMIINLVVLGGVWRVLGTQYKGVVVARLPFHPPGFITRISHMGLDGQDYYDCSVNFVFMLFSAGMRTNIVKAIGFGLSRELQKAVNPMARMVERSTK